MIINERGNTTSNLNNCGLAAIRGDWIYYRCNNKGNLFKIHIDGTGKIKLNDDSCLYINVVGDWVYYLNENDSMKTYKIKTDGSIRMLLSDDIGKEILVDGKWVYLYHRASLKPDYKNNYRDHQLPPDSYLKKIRVDGKIATIISKEPLWGLCLIGDWLYCNNGDDDRLIKMFADGSNKTILCDDAAYGICWDNDWIYYRFGNKIYRIRPDGSYKTELLGDYSWSYNVINDWIYYFDYGCDLYKMRTDGNEKVLLYEYNNSIAITDVSRHINVVGDWIFYQHEYEYWNNGNFDEEIQICKIRTDGTLHQIAD